MTKRIAVAQRKGGVGKTTISVCLAGEASSRGLDVALIDGDAQGSAGKWAEPGNLGFPVYQIALEGQTVGDWVRQVQGVSADLILVDTAPSDRALGAAIAIADLILVPCTPSGLDIDATAQTLAIVNAARARRNGWPLTALIPNQVDLRTLEGRQFSEELSSFGEPVGPGIGHRTPFVRAFAFGLAIADHAGGSIADGEIRRLYEFVEQTLDEGAPRPRSP
ncbi:MAG TPA: ParA family protein [Roseiarcus sp.]|nr:ParA family protein [Roseiarcus sp.]